MFGRNKLSQEEIEELQEKVKLDDALFDKLFEEKDSFEAGLDEIKESYRQVEAEVSQVCENCKTVSGLAEDNVKIEAELLHCVSELAEHLEQDEKMRTQLVDELNKVKEESARLVDENKHFTSPSKYLSELGANLRSQNRAYEVQLDQMAEYTRQMSVMSLNAAIEAGRMGESAQQFVTAAENIRTYSTNYDRATRELRSQIELSNHKIDEIEEQVKHIIRLLKENNVATAKLMKTCTDSVKDVGKKKDFSSGQDVNYMKSQLTILRNADEEIIKSEERNRMQLEDMNLEFESQKKNQKEIYQLMEPVFRHGVERKSQK